MKTKKACVKTARPIWIQQGLYKASKANMKPAKPIWKQQGLYYPSNFYMKAEISIWNLEGLYLTLRKYSFWMHICWRKDKRLKINVGKFGEHRLWAFRKNIFASLKCNTFSVTCLQNGKLKNTCRIVVITCEQKDSWQDYDIYCNKTLKE
jgi:hypothetical protein